MPGKKSEISPGLPTRPRIGVVGATGLVGEILLEVLEERGWPIAALQLFASDRSAGRRLRFRGEELVVSTVSSAVFADLDLVFFAATGGISRELGPEAVARGAVVIDKSSTWRLAPSVPLVVPEINAVALRAHGGIIACPNCTTIGVVMALAPLARAAGLRRVVATTMQAVSGVGRDGSQELAEQERARVRGEPVTPRAFPVPIAGNVLAQCGVADEDGGTDEEAKLRDETRKILDLPALDVTATCVRVPVEVGHSAALYVETVEPLPLARARAVLSEQPGVRLLDGGGRIPTPLDAAGQDEVLVGRVRHAGDDRRLWLWICVDNLRKGAATNAVQIAEALGAGSGSR